MFNLWAWQQSFQVKWLIVHWCKVFFASGDFMKLNLTNKNKTQMSEHICIHSFEEKQLKLNIYGGKIQALIIDLLNIPFQPTDLLSFLL